QAFAEKAHFVRRCGEAVEQQAAGAASRQEKRPGVRLGRRLRFRTRFVQVDDKVGDRRPLHWLLPTEIAERLVDVPWRALLVRCSNGGAPYRRDRGPPSSGRPVSGMLARYSSSGSIAARALR